MPVAVTSVISGVATSNHGSEANVQGRGGRSYSTAATPLQSNARGSETQHSILSLFLSPTFLSLPLSPSLSLSLTLHTWINPMSSNSTLVISGSSDTSGGEPQSKNSSFAGLYELSQSCAPPLMRGPTVLVADFRSGLAVPVEADRVLPLWPRAGADPMEKASAPDNSRHAAIAVKASLWVQPAPPRRLPCAAIFWRRMV